MLTPKEIEEMDALTGLQTAEKPASPVATNRVAELRATRQPVQKKESIPEKIGNVIGGTKIAQGLGQALAMKGNSKIIDDTQKMQMKIQGDLITKIREKKAKGEDTSRLMKALEDMEIEIGKFGKGAEGLLNPEKLTKKQVVGDAVKLATTVATPNIAGGFNKVIPGKGIGLLSGAARGAGVGASAGAVSGAAYGAGEGLVDDKDAKGVAMSSLTGGLLGGATGGVLGGLTGGVSGALKQRALNREKFVTDLVSPKRTVAEKEAILRSGRVEEGGIFRKTRATPSTRDNQVADAVKDVVSPKKSVIQNIDAIDSKLDDVNKGVEQYVKENKVPFNTNQLKARLNGGKDELKLIFASDANAEKTHNAVVKEFMKHVANKDTAGLLRGRKDFDKIPAIKKLLQTESLGENTRREIVSNVRRMANEYVADLLPAGNPYKADLLRQHLMLEAVENIAAKNTHLLDANQIQVLTQKYPLLKTLIGTGLVAAGLTGVGVGGAAILSSD